MPYQIERRAYLETIETLGLLLEPGSSQAHLEQSVRRILIDHPDKFYRIILQGRTANAPEGRVTLEPTEWMLRLVEAVRADSDDELRVLSHDLLS